MIICDKSLNLAVIYIRMADLGTVEPSPEGEAEISEPEPEGELAEPEWSSTPESLEPEAEPEFSGAELSIWIIAYSLSILLIIVGNSLLIAAMVKRKMAKKTASNVFLLSLVVSRAAVGLLVVPARITGVFSEKYLGSTLCKLCHYGGLTSVTSSVFSTTCVAFVKYKEIKHNGVFISHKVAIMGVLVLWLMSFLYAIRAPVFFDLNLVTLTEGAEPMWLCTISPRYQNTDSKFMFVDLVLLFGVPLLVILVSYWKAIKTLREVSSSTTRMDKVSKAGSESSMGETSGVKERTQRRQDSINTMRMLVMVAALFLLCTIAPYILRIYRYSNGFFKSYGIIEQIVYIWCYGNAWINVIVLVYFRIDLYDGMKAILCRSGYAETSTPSSDRPTLAANPYRKESS